MSLFCVLVILAPFGLAGVLTGQAYRPADWTTKVLDEWKRFFPLDYRSTASSRTGATNSDPEAPPPIVEVLVGGMKMRYPSCYVLVTDMDDDAIANSGTNPAMTGGTGTCITSSVLNQPNSLLSPMSPQQSSNNNNNDDMNAEGGWDYCEPITRASCTCSK